MWSELESVGALLQDSFDRIGEGDQGKLTQRILVAFGVLFATSATKDFLAAYVDRDPIVVEDVLGELLKRSLVKTEIRNADVYLYKVHDLTFSFVRVLAIERKLRDDRLVAAAERYMLAHGQDFELLLWDFLRSARIELPSRPLFAQRWNNSMLWIGWGHVTTAEIRTAYRRLPESAASNGSSPVVQRLSPIMVSAEIPRDRMHGARSLEKQIPGAFTFSPWHDWSFCRPPRSPRRKQFRG